MKGFLQHIAASVSRQEQNIHPLVASVYENDMRGEEVAPPAAMQEGLAVAHAAETAAPGIASAKDKERAVRERVERSVLRQAGDRSAAGDPPGKPLDDTVVKHDVGSQMIPPQHQREVDREVATTLRPPRRAPVTLEPLLVRVTPRHDGSDDNAGAGEEQIGKMPRAMSIQAPRPRAMERKAGPRAEEHGGEDIQIHIGRIEVTALPPAAPRASAAPVRRATSLDEYLKRRNGRAQ